MRSRDAGCRSSALGAVGDALAPEKRRAFERLEAAWQRRRTEAFDASMQVLADQLTRAAVDAEPLGDAEERAPLREYWTCARTPAIVRVRKRRSAG